MSWWHRLASPTRFMSYSAWVLPIAGWLAAGCIGVGLALGLFASPADYQQGETVRIMYVHVPAAWMALFCYSAMAASSAGYLIWKQPLAELATRATAPVGACFTAIALVSGSLWGQPMWGTWWVWDARLTSALVLFFLYLGYMALAEAFDDPTRGGKAASILALVGFVNVPIVKFSVDWWNTLHQPASVVKLDGPAIDPAMLVPLLLMAAGFTFYAVAVVILRLRAMVLERKIQALQRQLAEAR
ncbi:MAG: heme ABC transporter permease [Alphaproteobacteria bacterium]|nr:heme ABC transporter permease [Alphaproteobacteria bacterium]